MNSAKNTYRNLCNNFPSLPLFMKDWWLDIVCSPENWNVALAEKAGKILGVFPYPLKKKYGFKTITMPHLTQTLGPWLFFPPKQKKTTKFSFQKEVLTSLIQELPPLDFFSQNFHYSFENWLPFYWKGFQQTTRYTYILENLSDLESVFSNFRSNIKTDVRKAQRQVKVVPSRDIEQFYKLHKTIFEKQNLSPKYNFSLLRKIDESCSKKRCREILFAKDSQGKIHACVYLVWDETDMYYLMGGSDPSLRKSGAISLLIWESIQLASQIGRQFNFEGSMIENIERFFRSFGATQKPYFHISKINSPAYRFLSSGKSALQKLLRCNN